MSSRLVTRLVRAGRLWSLTRSVSSRPLTTYGSDLSYTSTDARTPVRLRMGEEFPYNKDPELVQTMVRRTVDKFPDSTAIAYKEWTNFLGKSRLNLISKNFTVK